MENDDRKWSIVSDYLGNDSQPYTTQQLFDFADKSNAENANDPDWTPFELSDDGDRIRDLSHSQGEEGYTAAVPFDEWESGDFSWRKND